MAVRKFGWFDFRNFSPGWEVANANGGAILTGASTVDEQVNAYVTPMGTLFSAQVGAAGAALNPVLNANGWQLPVPAANAIGIEIVPLNVANANSNCNFVLQTDPGIWVQATFSVATVANSLMAGVGFRTAGAFNGTTANYTTVANWVATTTLYNDVIGVLSEAGTAHTLIHSNSVLGTDTSTTVTETNATLVTYRVQIATGGTAVTYFRNGTQFATGGTGTAAGTDTLVPAFWFLNAAAANTTCTLQTFGWGIL